MLSRAIREIATHGSAFAMYIVILLLLVMGIAHFGGQDYLDSLLIYAGALMLVYAALPRLKVEWPGLQFRGFLGVGYRLAVIAAIVFVALHWYEIGHVPVVAAFLSFDVMEIARIRQGATEGVGSVWNYGSAILMRAVLPFFLFYGFVRRERMQPLLVIVAFLYSISLLQKSHVFMVFLPILVYAILRLRLLTATFYAGVAVAGVLVLLLASAPSYRPDFMGSSRPMLAVTVTNEEGASGSADSAALRPLPVVVAERMFLVPGMVAKQWFDLVPTEIPFQGGCGYRFLAPLLGCDHYNLPLEIYKKLYPEMVRQGVRGSVNVASFMEDYANWGNAGLLFSGALLAGVFWFIRGLFAADRVGEIALNIIPVLSLSSAALSTTLLSGGWVGTLLLYYVFRSGLRVEGD